MPFNVFTWWKGIFVLNRFIFYLIKKAYFQPTFVHLILDGLTRVLANYTKENRIGIWTHKHR